MSTISNTADFLRLLREDPDFRDEARRLLLTQELIELPERFARFEAYMERRLTEMQGDITEMQGDITEIKGDITEIKGDITEIRGDITEIRGDITEIRGDITEIRGDITETRGDITEIKGDLGRLKGAEYERKVSRSFSSYASAAFRLRNDRPLRRNRLLMSAGQGTVSEYEGLLSTSVDNGLITEEDLSELEQADAVMRGHDQNTIVYFVGEFFVTVNHHDIDRAVARANILGKATGAAVWPMVIGESVPGPQRVRAEADQVAFREVAQ